MSNRILTADVDGNRDFVLEGMSCWVTVGRAAVHIMRSDDGIAVDMYRDGDEMNSAVAGTWATWNEFESDEEDDTNALYKRQIHIRPDDNLILTWELVNADTSREAAVTDLDSEIFAHIETLFVYIAPIDGNSFYKNGMPITVIQYHVTAQIDAEHAVAVTPKGLKTNASK